MHPKKQGREGECKQMATLRVSVKYLPQKLFVMGDSKNRISCLCSLFSFVV